MEQVGISQLPREAGEVKWTNDANLLIMREKLYMQMAMDAVHFVESPLTLRK